MKEKKKKIKKIKGFLLFGLIENLEEKKKKNFEIPFPSSFLFFSMFFALAFSFFCFPSDQTQP